MMPSGASVANARSFRQETLMTAQPRFARAAARPVALAIGLLAAGALQAATPLLPALNIDIGQTSISGISSGGFMSVQFQVAHSAIVSGAGVVAGGPYNCSQADVMRAVSRCSCTGEPTVSCAVSPTSAEVATLVDGARALARQDKIDPTENLARQRVLTVSGQKDTLVPPPIAHDQLKAFYTALGVPEGSLSAVSLPNAGHTMPTTDFGIACNLEKEPYIGKCAYDGAGQILGWIYGGLAPAGRKPAGKFVQFNQRAYIPAERAGRFNLDTGLDNTAWAYIPDSCAKGEPCRVHIALHGCKQGQGYLPLTPPPGGGLYNGTTFVKHTGYDRWADNNHLVILYPQAVTTYNNPNGCWDWWGYTGADYATRGGVQIRTLRAMVDALAGKRR